MPFTVEDGTTVTDANAYIDVEFFRDWHSMRGVPQAITDTGDFETEKVQRAIVKATDFVDKRFGDKYVGFRRHVNDETQSLEWPRLDAFDSGGNFIGTHTIPKVLKRAVAEYALIALMVNDLLPVPAPSFNAVNIQTGETSVAQGGLLQRERVVVGPIEEEKWYNQEQWRLVLNNRASGLQSDMTSAVNLPEYPVADEWLKSIVVTRMSTTLSRG